MSDDHKDRYHTTGAGRRLPSELELTADGPWQASLAEAMDELHARLDSIEPSEETIAKVKALVEQEEREHTARQRCARDD